MKQYLLMVTEENLAFLNRVIPSIQYIEVIGSDIKEDPFHCVLLSPKPIIAVPAEEVVDTRTEAEIHIDEPIV